MSVAGMTCQELVELVTDYLEGRLDLATRARLERHLADCDGCTAYLEQFRTTIRLAGRLDPEAVGDDAMRALSAAFGAWQAEQPPRR
jgi:anti-sigma factor RsiW